MFCEREIDRMNCSEFVTKTSNGTILTLYEEKIENQTANVSE
jgi:hypothetical protein